MDHQNDARPQTAVPSSQLYAGAILATVGGLLAFLTVFLLRRGLGDSPTQVGSIFVLSILPIWFSVWAIANFGGTARGAAAAALIGIFLGVLLPALGLLLGPYVLAFGGAGLLFCLWSTGRRYLSTLRSAKAALILTALISTALLVALGATDRLFMPEEMILGTASSDAYWHAAIMQMIMRHWSVSIGADGLIHQNYHFLFHILVAGYSQGTSADLVLTYGYWSALTLKLQLVWSLFCAGSLLFRTNGDAAAAACWRMCYAWIAAILAWGFETESYILGIVLLAGFLPLLMLLLRGPVEADSPPIGAIALLCAAVFFVATAKSSAGYFCAIGLILLTWTYRERISVVIMLVATLVALAAFTEFVLIPKEVVLSDSTLSILVTSYITYFQRGVLLHYILPAVLVLIYLWQPRSLLSIGKEGALSLQIEAGPRLADRGRLPRWIAQEGRHNKVLRWFFLADVTAQFLFLTLLGALFVLFAIPIGDNVWDFSAVLYALSLLILPMALGETLNIRLTDKPIKWLLGIVLAANFLAAGMLFAFGEQSLPRTIVALYLTASGKSADQRSGAKEDILASIKATGAPFSGLHRLVDSSPVARLKRELDLQAATVNGNLAVYIPPEADEVWRFFEHTSPAKWCMYSHLLVPATAGVVEIRSVSPSAVEEECAPPGITWYGFGKYQNLHRTAAFAREDLCVLARPLGARKVYRLVSYSDLSRNSAVTCP